MLEVSRIVRDNDVILNWLDVVAEDAQVIGQTSGINTVAYLDGSCDVQVCPFSSRNFRLNRGPSTRRDRSHGSLHNIYITVQQQLL